MFIRQNFVVGKLPGDRAPCHNAVIADSHACVHHGVIQRDSDDGTQEMNAPIVGKMTPPEVFLGRSEWQGSWNRLRMAHLPREAIYS